VSADLDGHASIVVSHASSYIGWYAHNVRKLSDDRMNHASQMNRNRVPIRMSIIMVAWVKVLCDVVRLLESFHDFS
jgi:hypothetical protein